MTTFEEIRVGYTVRSTRNGVTREGVVEAIGPKSAHTKWPVVEIANIEDDSIEIVDRPKSAVEFPSVPTLGWLTIANYPLRVGRWRQYTSRVGPIGSPKEYVIQDEAEFPLAEVTAFTEAVAVPKSALDELRGNFDCSGPLSCLQEHLDAFLDAIDDASTR